MLTKKVLAVKDCSVYALQHKGLEKLAEKYSHLWSSQHNDLMEGIRDKQILKRLMFESEVIKTISPYTLDQCVKQLKFLNLTQLINIRSMQPDLHHVPDSLTYQQRFLQEIDRHIYRQLVDLLVANFRKKRKHRASDSILSSSSSSASTESLSYAIAPDGSDFQADITNLMKLLMSKDAGADRTKCSLGYELLIVIGLAATYEAECPLMLRSWWRLVVECPTDHSSCDIASPDTPNSSCLRGSMEEPVRSQSSNLEQNRRSISTSFADMTQASAIPDYPPLPSLYPTPLGMAENKRQSSLTNKDQKMRDLRKSSVESHASSNSQHGRSNKSNESYPESRHKADRIATALNRIEAARSHSVNAARRALKQSGKLLIDSFLNLETLELSDIRPLTAPVYLFRSSNWVQYQTFPMSLGSSSTIGGDIYLVHPSTSLNMFFRPSDATAAMRYELMDRVQRHFDSKTHRVFPTHFDTNTIDMHVPEHVKSSFKKIDILSKFKKPDAAKAAKDKHESGKDETVNSEQDPQDYSEEFDRMQPVEAKPHSFYSTKDRQASKHPIGLSKATESLDNETFPVEPAVLSKKKTTHRALQKSRQAANHNNHQISDRIMAHYDAPSKPSVYYDDDSRPSTASTTVSVITTRHYDDSAALYESQKLSAKEHTAPPSASKNSPSKQKQSTKSTKKKSTKKSTKSKSEDTKSFIVIQLGAKNVSDATAHFVSGQFVRPIEGANLLCDCLEPTLHKIMNTKAPSVVKTTTSRKVQEQESDEIMPHQFKGMLRKSLTSDGFNQVKKTKRTDVKDTEERRKKKKNVSSNTKRHTICHSTHDSSSIESSKYTPVFDSSTFECKSMIIRKPYSIDLKNLPIRTMADPNGGSSPWTTTTTKKSTSSQASSKLPANQSCIYGVTKRPSSTKIVAAPTVPPPVHFSAVDPQLMNQKTRQPRFDRSRLCVPTAVLIQKQKQGLYVSKSFVMTQPINQ